MTTRISDLVIPDDFDPYFRQETTEKWRLMTSGAVQRSPLIEKKLQGGGNTFQVPSLQDLANDSDDVMSDDPDTDATADKIESSQETQVRLARHRSWSSMDLAAALAGTDPMAAIAEAASRYWQRRFQAALVASVSGVFANNAKASPGGGATTDDLTFDVSDTFDEDTTVANARNVLEALHTMGDSWDDLEMVACHSVVLKRFQINNLITFIRESENSPEIPTFMGRPIIVDDGMPASSGDYETWFFGRGAIQFGAIPPTDSPGTETDRKPAAGNGGGQDVLHTRWHLCFHPAGHKFDASASGGGPSNASTSGNLAHEDSWKRAFPERNQIKLARLITTEHA